MWYKLWTAHHGAWWEKLVILSIQTTSNSKNIWQTHSLFLQMFGLFLSWKCKKMKETDFKDKLKLICSSSTRKSAADPADIFWHCLKLFTVPQVSHFYEKAYERHYLVWWNLTCNAALFLFLARFRCGVSAVIQQTQLGSSRQTNCVVSAKKFWIVFRARSQITFESYYKPYTSFCKISGRFWVFRYVLVFSETFRRTTYLTQSTKFSAFFVFSRLYIGWSDRVGNKVLRFTCFHKPESMFSLDDTAKGRNPS